MSRPVLMTVDDDPGVSRAVARDLRRKYGSEFRIVRAESGAGRAGRAEGADPARRADGRDPRRLPDARHERRRVPRAGDGHRPARPPRAAHRLRRHRRRDPRHQRRRRRPLPAQAVGAAGREALPGRRRADRDLAQRRRPLRRGDEGARPPLVGRVVRRPRLPGPQRRARTAGTTSRSPTAPGCSTAAGATADDVPVLVPPDGTRAQVALGGRDRRGRRASPPPRPPTSTTSS